MKICIKENEFNPSLLSQSWATEEFAIINGYKIIEIDEMCKDCIFEDFNEDLTFSIEKYNARKNRQLEEQTKQLEEQAKQNYENKIVAEIRKKYNINQELAILRQRDTKLQEYNEYFEYVESCKAKVKSEIGG